jgi:hypothetical protein
MKNMTRNKEFYHWYYEQLIDLANWRQRQYTRKVVKLTRNLEDYSESAVEYLRAGWMEKIARCQRIEQYCRKRLILNALN